MTPETPTPRLRYGVRYPDGSISGEITDSYRLAQAYANSDTLPKDQRGGTVYDTQEETP